MNNTRRLAWYDSSDSDDDAPSISGGSRSLVVSVNEVAPHLSLEHTHSVTKVRTSSLTAASASSESPSAISTIEIGAQKDVPATLAPLRSQSGQDTTGNSVQPPQQWVTAAKERIAAIHRRSHTTSPLAPLSPASFSTESTSAAPFSTAPSSPVPVSTGPYSPVSSSSAQTTTNIGQGNIVTTFSVKREERLHALAREFSVSRVKPSWKFQSKAQAFGSPSSSQKEDVQKLVKERAKLDGKTSLLRSNPGVNDLSAFLRYHVQAMGDVEVVNTLIVLGASVNILVAPADTLFKQKVAAKRSDVLSIAVKTGQTDVVGILVSKADQKSLNEALPHALSQANVDIIGCLLQQGADISCTEPSMLSAVVEGRAEVIEMLLTAPKKPSVTCINQSSIKAVLRGDARICSVLFQGGADPNFQDSEVLKSAIAMKRPDLIVAICLGPVKVHFNVLDKLVGHVWALHDADMSSKTRMAECLICAGAQGDISSQTLLAATQSRAWHIAFMMAGHGVSTDFREGAALTIAVEDSTPNLVDHLLRSDPTSATLDAVLSRSKTKLLNGTSSSLDCIRAIMAAGPSLKGLAHLLHSHLQTLATRYMDTGGSRSSSKDIATLNLLAQRGLAGLTAEAAELIRVAVTGPLDILKALLSHGFAPATIDQALPAIEAMKSDDTHRERVLQICLKAGAKGQNLDERLVQCAQNHQNAVESSRKILNNTSVDYKDGLALRIAMQRSDMELFDLLLSAHPSEDTLTRLWAETLAIEVDTVRQQFLEKLFQVDPRQVVFEDISVMMVKQAMNASSQYMNTCQMLFSKTLSHDVVNTAFEGALTVGDSWKSPQSLPIIQLLLASGAEGHAVDLALLEAAGDAELDAVNLLCGSVSNPDIFTDAFQTVLYSEHHQLLSMALDVFEALIQCGPSVESLSMGLVHALDELEHDNASHALIDLLLYSGADVNMNDGLALSTATFYGSVEFTRRLLEFGPSVEVVNRCFYQMLQAGHDEAKVLELLEVFDSCPTGCLDVNSHPAEQEPAIFMSLMLYPNSVPILKRMVALGANLETKIETFIYEQWREDMLTTPEMATVLTWAITQRGEDTISDEVIKTIIHAGAKVDVLTPKTRSSALMLAASMQRNEVVRSLLFDAKAHPSFKNSFGDSALCYASHINNLGIVKDLIKANAAVNDGSLHEAVREMRPGIVRVLLEAGHSADHTSTRHEGRTPLGELCLLGDSRVEKDESRQNNLEEVLNALASQGRGFDVYKTWHQKTMLFVVLDNIIDPVGILDKLIERVFNRIINDSENILQVGDYFYSPLSYVEHGILEAPQENKKALAKLLYNHGARRRYYAKKGLKQPEDTGQGGAEGLPEDIVKYEDWREKRLEKLRDYEIQYQQNAELAQQKLEHKQALQDQRLKFGNEIHQQKNEHMKITLETQLEIKWRKEVQDAAFEQKKAEAKLERSRKEHQEKMQQMTQEQRAKHAFEVKKLDIRRETNVLKAAANRDAIKTVKEKNDLELSSKQASSRIQKDSHKIKMQEIKAKGKAERNSNKMKLQQIRAKRGEPSGIMKAVKVAQVGLRVAAAVHTFGASEGVLSVGGALVDKLTS